MTENKEQMSKAAVLTALEKLTDSELQEVAKRAQAIPKERETERRREALREIQRLAKEHGIKVDVKEGRRRGRPAKAKEA
jgi:nucleotide-binding universal stress UspA family protein